MIETKEQLFESTALAVVVTRELAEQLQKSTRNAALRSILDKTDKDVVVIPAGVRQDLFERMTQLEESINKARTTEGKGKGGRPRIQDPVDPSTLTGETLRRYKFRMWQRESRERRRKVTA
jgi:hypothetical protein